MSFIHVQNLQKHFVVRKKRGKGSLFREKEIKEALKGVSFDIGQGELVGYIGRCQPQRHERHPGARCGKSDG